ncbi:hypothetical protein BDQ17DRAFT_1433302 [Cyathus striatus]|nr:hypothetical protein BDQ17DRAFT_1433302 [Cyathus striatus]
MGRPKKKQLEKLSQARATATSRTHTTTIQEPNDDAPAETDKCTWDGSVNHWTLVNDSDDSDYSESIFEITAITLSNH